MNRRHFCGLIASEFFFAIGMQKKLGSEKSRARLEGNGKLSSKSGKVSMNSAARRKKLYQLLGDLPPRQRAISPETIGTEERAGYFHQETPEMRQEIVEFLKRFL